MLVGAQVKEAVDTVDRAFADAVADLDGFWISDQRKAYLNGLKSIEPTIARWASVGFDAAGADTAPKNGWKSWTKNGRFLAGQIASFVDGGQTAWLADIEVQTIAAGKDAKRIVKKTARVANDAAGEVVSTVAGPLSMVAIPLAVVALAFLAYRFAK